MKAILNLFSKSKIIAFLVFLLASIFLAIGLSFFTPAKAKNVPLPFTDGNCLVYKIEQPTSSMTFDSTPTCFQVYADGSFLEKSSPMQASFTKDGLSRLTDDDISNWKKNLNGGNDRFFYKTAKDLKFHNRYYAEPGLQPGMVFYDGYPVKKITDYNGKRVYLVEISPAIDTEVAAASPLNKLWIILKRQNRLIYKPTIRISDSKDTVKRAYYNLETGILEGEETFQTTYDSKWNVLQENLIESRKLKQIVK